MEARSSHPPPTVFRGRAVERDRMAGLLDRVRAGASAALVVSGEPGIGKTALLDDVARQASGFHVARMAGRKSEKGLPLSGFRRLCAPMFTTIERLPVPQQNALTAAFDSKSHRVADHFLVGLSTLGLLTEGAVRRPLLCVVDDAQWLDTASAQVFGFVARRLLTESVLMVFALRGPPENHHLGGLPELVLPGLAVDDARALLVSGTPGRVDVDVRDRIVAETGGNPSALLESLREVSAAELTGGFAVPRTERGLNQLERHLLERVGALPPATQQLLLIAAADPTGDVAVLRRAAHAFGIEREMFASINAESLVDIGVRVHLRHPRIRSAIYNGAATKDRRAVHLALAAAVDEDTQPDRRAWHRALAATGPDEEVASELERSARRAESRGGQAATAAFMQRSMALTPDPRRRANRALAAARAQLQAGAFDEALRLLAIADNEAIEELQRAHVDLLRAQIASAAGPETAAPAQLLEAAKRLQSVDAGLARETYLDAWAAAMVAGQPEQNGHLRDVSQSALAAPPPSGSPRPSDLLLEGLSSVVEEGCVAAIPILRRAIRAFLDAEVSVESGLRWRGLASVAAAIVWDFDRMQEVLSRQSELARSAGALTQLCFTLNGEVLVVAWRGDLARAATLAAESDALTEALGTRAVASGALLVAALAGDERHAFAVIEAAVEQARVRGEGMALQLGLWAAAVLSNSLARYEQAMSLSLQASEGANEFFIGPWALTELVEAAVRTGNNAVALDALERLGDSTKPNDGDWARGILARGQALVDSGPTAEANYREAIDCLGRTALRPELARAHLLYGEWLRGQKRRGQATEQLRVAYDMFREMGMRGFAERSRHELRATGENVRKPPDDAQGGLTRQERQIARLAVAGLTNPEIGAQLFISARTVEWHLRKVFTKLGVHSRRALRHALPPGD